MRRSRSIRGAANIGCIVWLAIVGVVGYVLWKVVPVKIASSEFYDAMQEQAAFGSIKDPKLIEFEILRKADELKIPVKLIGIGEQLEDLRPFDPDDFAKALLTA